jgi:hypothetical protein
MASDYADKISGRFEWGMWDFGQMKPPLKRIR